MMGSVRLEKEKKDIL